MNKPTADEVKEELGSARNIYKDLETHRRSMEQTWRDCSELTLPYIFPMQYQSESSVLPTPYNSLGASSVNALASKLLVALLPPSGTFFRLLPDEGVTKELDTDTEKKLDMELSQIEQLIIEVINQRALRVPTYEALKLLVTVGNALLYKIPDGTIKVFSPYQYVVQRDYAGNILTICIEERVAESTLPNSVLSMIEENSDNDTEVGDNDEVFIYTCIARQNDNSFVAWQEIKDTIIEGTIKIYKKDLLPYIPLRWTTVNNEDYGRGLVEQYLGDFRSLEALTQIIVEGGGIMGKVIFGVKPGSPINTESLNNAQNGDVVLGDLERDITTLHVNKAADFSIPFQLMGQLEARLSKAFLMLSGNIRDSERTTSTEVRATIAELEATLGGVYSVLASEFQTPLVTLLLNELAPKALDITVPSITTGIGAISRERDFTNLQTMLQAMSQLGENVLLQNLKVDAYLAQVATSLGIEADSIVKSPEEKQQEQQAQLQQQAAMQQMQTNSQMQVEQAKQQQ